MTPQRFNGGEPRRAEGFLIKYNTFDMGFIRVTILARSFAVVAGLLAVAWSAIPVSAQDSRPGRTRPVPFRVGERLTYDVKWSSFLVRVTAGTVTMDITGRRPSPEDLVHALVPPPESILNFQDGWHQREGDGDREWRWSAGDAIIAFRNPRQDSILYVELDGRPDLFDSPQRVDLVVGERTIDSFSVEASGITFHTAMVSADDFGDDDTTELALHVDQTFVPAELPDSSGVDTRRLGVRVFNVFLTGRRPSPEDLVYAVVAEARLTRTLSKLYSLYYRAETLIDAETLLPRRGSIHTEEGKRRRTKLTRFDQLAHRAEYEIRTATVVTQELTVPAGVQDALSALYALRAMPWKSGEAFSIPVSDSGKIYTVHVAVGESERVKTGLGTLSALQASLRVVEEGVGPLDRRMDLWVSDDSRRLPVKVQIDLPVGSFVLLLKQVS